VLRWIIAYKKLDVKHYIVYFIMML